MNFNMIVDGQTLRYLPAEIYEGNAERRGRREDDDNDKNDITTTNNYGELGGTAGTALRRLLLGRVRLDDFMAANS